ARVARVGGQLGRLQGAAQGQPLPVVDDADGQPDVVPAAEGLVRRGGGAGAAQRQRLLAGGEVLGEARRLHGDGGGGHVDVDRLAKACAVARHQRLEDGGGDVDAGVEVDLALVAQVLTATAGRAGDAGPAAEALADAVAAAHRGHRPAAAPGGADAVDDARVDAAHLLVAEAQLGGHAEAQVVDEDVAGAQQRERPLPVRLVLEVEQEELLVH